MTSEFSTPGGRLAGKAKVVKLEDRTRRETKEYPAPDAAARLEVGASKRKASRPSHRDVPVIQIRAGALSEIATQSEKALLESGVQLYQRGAALVRPIVDEVEAAHGTRTKVAQLARVDAVYLRDLLGRVAEFQKFDGRSKAWMPTNPPFEIASTILARLGEWKFPVVAGVLSTPTMRPDGTILGRAGYDAATRLLLIEPPAMPEMPDDPTRGDALAALALLDDLLAEFPLVDDTARAVALSALITPVARGAFPVTPKHVARAPVASSGKSFLFDVVAAIATGQKMPVMAAGAHEEETEKRLGAALLTGQPLISIDNVNGELSSDALCQIIERPIVDIRILGKTERVRITARGTSLFCTGNNIVMVGDLCRRIITATLDPELERPELREFKGNPVAAVLANRGAYVAAALTICRAYVVAGRPNLAPRLASFEAWSDTVRSALTWLGRADPVDSMEIARAEDPQLGALRGVLDAWANATGVGWRFRSTLQEIIKLADERWPEDQSLRRPELHDAVQSVAAGNRGAPADVKRLGNWMRQHKGRVVGDLRLMNQPSARGGAATWWVEHKNGPTDAGKSRTGSDAGGAPL